MTIGIIGLGSIGRKHVHWLLQLGVERIVALRTYQGSKKSLPEGFERVEQVSSFEAFAEKGVQGIIIANPSSMHIDSLVQVLPLGVPVFVEKPLCTDLASLEQLQGMDTSQVVVGFCLRFNPVIRAVKDTLNSGKLGRIVKMGLQVGQYLPDWHPDCDYREEYYSRKDQGGGAIRTLSHELDLLLYFMGMPEAVIAVVERASALEIDVDDTVVMIGQYHDKAIAKVEIDFLQPEVIRSGEIIGENGKLAYDVIMKTVRYFGYDGTSEDLLTTAMPQQDMYEAQMTDFIGIINKSTNTQACTYQEAVMVDQLVEKAEAAHNLKKWEWI